MGKRLFASLLIGSVVFYFRILMFTVFQNSHQDAENDDFDPLEEYYDPEGGYDSYEVSRTKTHPTLEFMTDWSFFRKRKKILDTVLKNKTMENIFIFIQFQVN